MNETWPARHRAQARLLSDTLLRPTTKLGLMQPLKSILHIPHKMPRSATKHR